jgi:uncharacterized Zn-finger protein
MNKVKIPEMGKNNKAIMPYCIRLYGYLTTL